MIFSDRICIEFDYCFILIWLVNFMYLFENSYFLLNRLLLIISPTSETRSSNIKIKVALIVNSYSYFHSFFYSFYLFLAFLQMALLSQFLRTLSLSPIIFIFPFFIYNYFVRLFLITHYIWNISPIFHDLFNLRFFAFSSFLNIIFNSIF